MESLTRLRTRASALDASATAALTIPEGSRVRRRIALVVAHSGDSFVWAALLIGAWLLGGRPWRTPVLLTVLGLLIAEVAVFGIKAILKRKRPPGTDGRIYRRYDPYSFPSGHAARAAMLCILSGVLTPLPVFLAILVWSPLMLLARIAIGIHYVLDVLGGIILGTALTFFVLYVLGSLVPLF
jgi:membrane-associated phospholipid phosphatase